MVSGSEHSFALSTEGEVFSWGLNFKGQLGLGDFENRAEPTLVECIIPNVEQNSKNQNTQLM